MSVRFETKIQGEATLGKYTHIDGPKPIHIGGGHILTPGCVLELDTLTPFEYRHQGSGNSYGAYVEPGANPPVVHIKNFTNGLTLKVEIGKDERDLGAFAVSLLQ